MFSQVSVCPQGGSLSRGGLCPGGSLFRGSLSRGFTVLCPERPPYGNVRAVHILLECILVTAVNLLHY